MEELLGEKDRFIGVKKTCADIGGGPGNHQGEGRELLKEGCSIVFLTQEGRERRRKGEGGREASSPSLISSLH